MKVLGVGKDKYICEIEWDEMYEVIGGNSADEDIELLQAGDEVDLQRLIRAARWVRELDNEHVERVIKELRLTLIGMERVKETAGALNLFNKLRDDVTSE